MPLGRPSSRDQRIAIRRKDGSAVPVAAAFRSLFLASLFLFREKISSEQTRRDSGVGI